MGATEVRRQPSVPAGYDVADEDDMYVSRSPSSARRYKPPIQHDTLDDPSATSSFQSYSTGWQYHSIKGSFNNRETRKVRT